MEFDENSLPWHFAGDAVTVVLVEEDGLAKNPIVRTPIVADPVVALPIRLRKGQRESRDVHLDRYYNNLTSILAGHDVTMIWLYRPLPSNVGGFQVVTGALRLRRVE